MGTFGPGSIYPLAPSQSAPSPSGGVGYLAPGGPQVFTTSDAPFTPWFNGQAQMNGWASSGNFEITIPVQPGKVYCAANIHLVAPVKLNSYNASLIFLKTGQILGTIPYASPELTQSDAVPFGTPQGVSLTGPYQGADAYGGDNPILNFNYTPPGAAVVNWTERTWEIRSQCDSIMFSGFLNVNVGGYIGIGLGAFAI